MKGFCLTDFVVSEVLWRVTSNASRYYIENRLIEAMNKVIYIFLYILCNGGSLCGGNSYSEKGLNIPSSVASQNIIIIGDTIEVTPTVLY